VEKEFGTVGAVALDAQGNICAATSTGGMTNKKWGRVGDAPIIGAGTYADNTTCGVSATGWGEFFIRAAAAHSVSEKIRYQGKTVTEAGQEVIDDIGSMGGDGGMIILDRAGNIAMPFNTSGMYRGYIRDGELVVRIFKE
jgi:beta-aspartyl-peptidase (threonine type)